MELVKCEQLLEDDRLEVELAGVERQLGERLAAVGRQLVDCARPETGAPQPPALAMPFHPARSATEGVVRAAMLGGRGGGGGGGGGGGEVVCAEEQVLRQLRLLDVRTTSPEELAAAVRGWQQMLGGGPEILLLFPSSPVEAGGVRERLGDV